MSESTPAALHPEDRGYRASAAIVERAERRRAVLRSWINGSVAAAIAAPLLVPAAPVAAAAAGAGVVAFLLLASWVCAQWEREALDRMVELDGFAPPTTPRRAASAAARRRAELLSRCHRMALARAVRRSAELDRAALRAASPGAAALARNPDLAGAIARQLEADDRDGRLPVAVERLLSAGGRPGPHLDRIRRLVT